MTSTAAINEAWRASNASEFGRYESRFLAPPNHDTWAIWDRIANDYVRGKRGRIVKFRSRDETKPLWFKLTMQERARRARAAGDK